MPLYEFKCRVCGNDFEELVRRSDDEADVACPVCGTRAATRLLSAPALRGLDLSGLAGGSGGSGCGGGHGGFT